MPPSHAPIPLPGRPNKGSASAAFQPAFSAPVQWAILVLSWLAFLIAGYLAIHSVSGASVAGCGVGSTNGCDVVLSSSWSKWLGIPVAVLGLAVYAALASLSPLLWWRNEEASRWITTAIVLLSVVVAGASLWFIGVQIFAIHEYCKFCLVTDTCGILLGAIASFAAVSSASKSRPPSSSSGGQSGVMALRSAMPIGARPTATTIPPTVADPPALGIAFGGAVPLLAVLIAGQMLFASKTYEVQKITLTDSIEMTGSPSGKLGDDSAESSAAKDDESSTDKSEETAIARVTDESEAKNALTKDAGATDGTQDPASETSAKQEEPSSPPAAPEKERIVKFLGGTLSLDVYKHPLIGSPEAPHIAIEMVSYDCSHCRKMAAMIEQALEHYGDQVAVIVMPYPFNKECNAHYPSAAKSFPGACGTARRACGVAKLNPSSFANFHKFLMTGEEAPSTEKVLPRANRLVSGDLLRSFVNSPEAKKQIAGYVDLLAKLQEQNKSLGLPVQILGDKIVFAEVEKIDDLFKAWEENLGVKPK